MLRRVLDAHEISRRAGVDPGRMMRWRKMMRSPILKMTPAANRAMLKCLPESLRSRTREYLKTRRIRVHKATVQEIEGLLSYINQLGDE